MAWYKDPTSGRWLNDGATSGQAHDRNGATNTGANRRRAASVADPRHPGRYTAPPGSNGIGQRPPTPPRTETYSGPPAPNLAVRAAQDPAFNEPFYQRLGAVRSNLAASGIQSAQAHAAGALGARGLGGLGTPGGAGTYVNDALAAARGGVGQDIRSDAAGMRYVSRERRVNEARGFQYQQSAEGMKRLLNNWLDNDQINAERYKRVLGLIGQSAGDLYGG